MILNIIMNDSDRLVQWNKHILNIDASWEHVSGFTSLFAFFVKFDVNHVIILFTSSSSIKTDLHCKNWKSNDMMWARFQ